MEAESALLAAEGVGPGDRVAILALNHPRTLALLFACAKLGAILTPLNWRLAAPELAWILEDAAPKLLLTDHTAPTIPLPKTRTLPLENKPSPPGRGLGGASQGSAGALRPRNACGGEGPATGQPVPTTSLTPTPTLPDTKTDLLLVYTSGTTGRPKGAVLSSAALLANTALSRHMHGLTHSDHILTTLPLFHVGGLNIQTLPALLAGATVTLHPRFDPAATLAAIAVDQPTLTVLVPATLQSLLAHPAWPGADLSSLRAITTGSTVVQPAITAPFTARGVPVLQVYGSTETAPIAIYTSLGQPAALTSPIPTSPIATSPIATSTGLPGPGTEARAMDDEGHLVPSGTPGEIWLRGPQLFSRYWQNPTATAEALQDGWYRTGDIGTQSPDGTWTVHDRKKNLIVSGGENIYPAEIERVLHEMPQIAEAAVIGRPDPSWQEVPEAHIVLRPGAACTEADILAYVQTQLARYKTPRRVHFVPSLPRNAMGKIQHAELRVP